MASRITPPEPGTLAKAIEEGLQKADGERYWYAKVDAIEAAVRGFLDANAPLGAPRSTKEGST